MEWCVPNDPSIPEKPGLVLLHGFAGNGIMTWQIQLLSLRKDYTIYIPSLPFFGGSTTASEERSTKFQAECLAMGLKQLGVDKCFVVGFSDGGMVGFQLAEHYPDLVAGLVVTGAVLAMSGSSSEKALKRAGFVGS